MNIVIKNTTSRVILLSNPYVQLVPGQNDVDDRVWERNKRLKENQKTNACSMWMEKGYIQETKLEKATPLADETNLVDQDNMLRKIAKCDRAELVIKWARSDNRPAVKKAAEGRLLELSRMVEANAIEADKSDPVMVSVDKVITDEPAPKATKKKK